MAVSSQTGDREEQTRQNMLAIVREMADTLAHDSSQITETHTERDDIEGYVIDNPITAAKVYTKRGVTSDGWGYVWERIHVEINHKTIGFNRLNEIKNNHNLEVVDIWQSQKNMEAEMGQHGNPAISFALEPRE